MGKSARIRSTSSVGAEGVTPDRSVRVAIVSREQKSHNILNAEIAEVTRRNQDECSISSANPQRPPRSKCFSNFVVCTSLTISDTGESLKRESLEPLPKRINRNRLEHLCRKRIREQLARLAVRDAAALHIEQRRFVDPANRCAVRALHVIGKDLELGLRVDPRALGQQQRVVGLLAVRLL